MFSARKTEVENTEILHHELAGCEAALQFIRERQSLYLSSELIPLQLKHDADLWSRRIEMIREELHKLEND